MPSFDLIVIGAGWAGINASLRAAKLGLKVALIERDLLGGVCLNLGCIPTKALIHSAKIYLSCLKSPQFGINLENIKVDFKAIQQRKNTVIDRLYKGIEFLIKSRANITYIKGNARLISPQEVSLDGKNLKANYIILATGSKPQDLPFLKFDGRRILSSDDVLRLDYIPKSILIVGGGVIGCEFASLFNMLKAEVTIVEILERILPQEDIEVSKKLETVFKKRGIKIYTSTDIRNIDVNDYQIILVCIGRKPDTSGLGLEELGINLDRSRVITDEYLKTNIPNIYAIGDCTNKLMLAYLASHQGHLVVDNILFPERKLKIYEENVPSCIFTYPEVSRVGLTEQKAKELKLDIRIDRFDFLGLGMAHIMGETDGFIKIISDRKDGLILGASILGGVATEMIGILTLAIQNKLKIKDLESTIFAHPSFSESILEALR
ncbi:MAG: dihydrolipoyl dehydrogenase [Candidatus Omnitrophica bacterium]|nr:dihydrolipoyl dehydrogenase [Candidatus Omnitrophota bacterium]